MIGGPVIWMWLPLMVLGMPIFLAISTACTVYLAAHGEILLSIPQRLTAAANSFPLLAAPYFMLTGMAMNTAGITRRIFEFRTSSTSGPGGPRSARSSRASRPGPRARSIS